MEFYICQKLGWKSVKQMRNGLSNLEFQQWLMYYARIAQRKELADKEMRSRMH